MEDSQKIKNILCDTLGRIGSVCIKVLEECFSSEDLVRMTRSHLAEMQKFLVTFAGGKIGDDDLIGCGVVEVSESEHLETDTSQNSFEKLSDAAETNYDFDNTDLIRDVSENTEPSNKASQLTDVEISSHEEHAHNKTDCSGSGRELAGFSLFICLLTIYLSG